MPATFHFADIPSHSTTPTPGIGITLRSFRRGSLTDARAFRALNEAWIEKHFTLEPSDRAVLNDPEGHILDEGGRIFFAIVDGVIAGCCALIPMDPGVYEVAKMAVDEQLHNRGIGRKILVHTIEQARAFGATRLYLETNSRLVNAIHLYESLGFEHLPPRPSPYARANVFMQLCF
jgi:N-acetylglutamate synthase-like GNAT family acetyltransferase